LAVGDIINVSTNGVTSWQPAAGIEIIVLKTFSGASPAYMGMSNGTVNPNSYYDRSDTSNSSGTGIKYGITNTLYYYNSINGTESGFSGIQIK
jgi:hypothetical protein|tara:strand:+ start:343 stop:621 length:279 start_codon:yes stop_codon:yes gene_type:complete